MPSSKDTGIARFYKVISQRWGKLIDDYYGQELEVNDCLVTSIKYKYRSTDVLVILIGQLDDGTERVAFLSGSDFFDATMVLFEKIGTRDIEWQAQKKWD